MVLLAGSDPNDATTTHGLDVDDGVKDRPADAHSGLAGRNPDRSVGTTHAETLPLDIENLETDVDPDRIGRWVPHLDRGLISAGVGIRLAQR